MAPPTVVFTLPSNDQLFAAATPNPEAEAARLTTGNPAQLRDLGHRLQRAGAELDRVHGHSVRAQRTLGGSFTNDGVPVYDQATHARSLPPGFPDAGTRLHDVGRRVAVCSLELSSAIDDVNSSTAGLAQQLDGRRRGFAAELDAARGPGGLIPEPRLAALQARQAAVAAEMQQLTTACGREVVARIGRYEIVLDEVRRLLGELAAVPGAVPGGVWEGRPGASGITVPAPPGPTGTGFPYPPVLPREPGFTPLPGGVTGPVITIPAPDVGGGVQDGPGSGQRDTGPPVTINPNSPGGPPAGAEGDDEPLEDFEGTGFSRDEVEEFINGHTDDGNPTMGRPSAHEVSETIGGGTRTPLDNGTVQYDKVVNGERVRIYVNPGLPFRSTAFYPDRSGE